MTCPTPHTSLPENFQGARLVYGVGWLERTNGDGGCFTLPSGWYYSDAGRARIAATVDRWQDRVDDLQARMDAMHARIESRIATQRPASPPHHCPPEYPHPAPSVLLGFVVGVVVGRLTLRRPRGAA